MKTIVYSITGEAYPDGTAEHAARLFLRGDADYCHVSTSNFVAAVRALLKEEYIAHTDVQFEYNGWFLQPDKNGQLPRWPRGFCDHFSGWLDRRLS